MSSTGKARRDRRRSLQATREAPPAVQPMPASPWLVTPAFDVAIYATSTLWGAALVLALAAWIEPIRIWFAFNIVFTAAHYGPTWLRAYADRDERAHNKWSLYCFPPAVFGFAYLTRGTPEVFAFITFLWDRWHAVMQNYGFLRLYDAKAATSSRRRARLDFALLITTALLILSLNMGLFAPLLSAFDAIGFTPVTSVTTVRVLQIAFGLATVVAAFAWIVEARRVPRAERARQVPRLAFLVCLIGGHGLMNTTSNIFILSSHEKIYHSLQYLALSWHFSKRRAERAPASSTGTVFRAVFAPKHWPLYLLVVAAWTVLAFLGNSIVGGDAIGPGLFTAVIGSFALCHYYFDSFLWRVRRPQVRASL